MTKTSQHIHSISEFLLHAGTDFRVFDMGRHFNQMTSQKFLEIENGTSPAPFPKQKKVWLGLAFWQVKPGQAKVDNPYFWFVCLPIDEQSKVISASRDQFLETIVQALQDAESVQEKLPNNPYLFEPSETQRGQIIATLRAQNIISLNEYTVTVQSYIRSPFTIDWQRLVSQSIFDAAPVINQDDSICEALLATWDNLADTFKQQLLLAFEPLSLNVRLTNFFQDKAASLSELQNHYLCALSRIDSDIGLTTCLISVLQGTNSADLDTLSVIAARHGHNMTPAVLNLFFQRSLELDEKLDKHGEILAEFYQDLVYIPAVRPHVLNTLRNIK